MSGGAISILGSALSTVLIDDSVFDSNSVARQDTGAMDITVRLRTGSQDIGGEQYFTPIWRIDDGPVYGIPWEQSQGALRRSEESVRKGFAPSWPNLNNANVSYSGPYRTYSHVLSVTEGQHTLWTGLLVMVCAQPTNMPSP
eukprot:COSAG04_NODE_3793_length_2526_cov_1.479604_3_plen_142_part_00